MSLSAYNPHERYRKRKTHRFVSFMIGLSFIACLLGLGFWIGKNYGLRENTNFHLKAKTLEAENEELQNRLIEMRVEAQTANMRYEQLQESYADIISEGPLQELTTLLRAQLESGMDPQRLAFVIRSANPPSNCSDPETRRFVVSTPTYQGAESAVQIADGELTIKAKGISVRNKNGKPEAWYDPTKPVEIQFIHADGKTETKKGVMDLQHSTVIGEREYRFTIAEGARSFAKVTFDSCDYP